MSACKSAPVEGHRAPTDVSGKPNSRTETATSGEFARFERAQLLAFFFPLRQVLRCAAKTLAAASLQVGMPSDFSARTRDRAPAPCRRESRVRARELLPT